MKHSLLFASPKENWQREHNEAIQCPEGSHERSITAMLAGWITYSRAYYESFGFEIGNNPVVGDAWAKLGREIKVLLACNRVGRLDRAILTRVIDSRLKSEGFDP